jgi:hypothetical protein
MLLAKTVYSAYPYSDELDIDPPEPNETLESWYSRIQGDLAECGDTLFAAILCELNETIDDRPVRALRRFQDDVEIIIQSLIKQGFADSD